uniref:Uncharacterized protein n=1 Tax=viral metagenome TaxID=1070528 RepID=A0A6C0DVT5_9ZZZZ
MLDTICDVLKSAYERGWVFGTGGYLEILEIL